MMMIFPAFHVDYLEFDDIGFHQMTRVILVSRRCEDYAILGRIKWQRKGNKYVFEPHNDKVTLDGRTLEDIGWVCKRLTAWHRGRPFEED